MVGEIKIQPQNYISEHISLPADGKHVAKYFSFCKTNIADIFDELIVSLYGEKLMAVTSKKKNTLWAYRAERK